MGTRKSRRLYRRSQTFISSAGTPTFQQFDDLGKIPLIAGWEDSLVGHYVGASEYMTYGEGDSNTLVDRWEPTGDDGDDFRYNFRERTDQYNITGRQRSGDDKFNGLPYIELEAVGIEGESGAVDEYGGMQSTVYQNLGISSDPAYTTGSGGSGFSAIFVLQMKHSNADIGTPTNEFYPNSYIFDYGNIKLMTGDGTDPNQFRFIVGNVSASFPSGALSSEQDACMVVSYNRSAATIDCWIDGAAGVQGVSVPVTHQSGPGLTASLGFQNNEAFTDEIPGQAGRQIPSRLRNSLFISEFGFYRREMDAPMITRIFEYCTIKYGI